MPRKIITEKLKELGVTVAGSVSKKTNYLITDDAHTGSSKAVAAMQNNTPIISSAKALEIFKLN
jgi:NAD-dependent DNA ligase